MVVFSDEFINEHFPVLADTLSTSQEDYLEQFRFIRQKGRAYCNVIHKLHYLVKDFFEIPDPEYYETVESLVPQHIFHQYENAIEPIWVLFWEMVEMREQFKRYEQISPVLSEYWSVKKDLLEAIKKADQLKPVLELRKQDLALFKKQHQIKGAKRKAKRSDKSTREDLRTLESHVKKAQAEVNAAEKSLSPIYNHIAELQNMAGDRDLPFQSEWEKMVPKSYNKFRQLARSLLEEIKKIQDLFASYTPASGVTSVCITQTDLDMEKNKCPICLRDYSVGEMVKSCGHCKQFIDEGCMAQWLKEKDICPLCRQNPWHNINFPLY